MLKTSKKKTKILAEKIIGIPGKKRRSRLFYQLDDGLPIVDHADGIYLWDTNGKKYLDAVSGAFVSNIGHAHKQVRRAAMRQMKKVSFAYRTQFENKPAIKLANFLVRLSPKHLNRVFFVNSGSEAVESCVKLARQYWWAQGRPEKKYIISRSPSYHGATLGALPLTSYTPLNEPFEEIMVNSPKVSAPFCYRCPLGKTYPSCKMACAHELEMKIKELGANNVAAFITEPIGGASTGGAVPPDEWFKMVEDICRRHDVLLIVDEVLTGAGRTGTFYGFEHWGIKPDLVALAKGLSAGYSPIGACVTRKEIVDVVMGSGGFKHGHTMAGNPLSTAVAAEVLKIMTKNKLMKNAWEVGHYMHEQLHKLKDKYSFIGDVRGIGLLAGVEFVKDPTTGEPFEKSWAVAAEVTEIGRKHGLLLYPRNSIRGEKGDHICLAPPLTIDRNGIDEMISLLDLTLQDLATSIEKYVEESQQKRQTFKRFDMDEPTFEDAFDLDEVIPEDKYANVNPVMDDGYYRIAEDTGEKK